MTQIPDNFPKQLNLTESSIPDIWVNIAADRARLDKLTSMPSDKRDALTYYESLRHNDQVEALKRDIAEQVRSLGERAYFLIGLEMKEGEN